MYDTSEDFKSRLINKLQEIESCWKIMFYMRDFIEDILFEKFKREIDSTWGTGLNIFVQIDK